MYAIRSYYAYKEYLAGLDTWGPAANNVTAIAHYRRALELDPEFVKPRFMIIRHHFGRSEWAETEREIGLVKERRDRLTPINMQRLRRNNFV